MAYSSYSDTTRSVFWKVQTTFWLCWRIEVKGCGFHSHAAFTNSKPSWASIIELSEAMVKRYLPGGDFDEKREEPKTKHNMVFENVALHKHMAYYT
jgi:hypothetical protein